MRVFWEPGFRAVILEVELVGLRHRRRGAEGEGIRGYRQQVQGKKDEALINKL